MSAQTFLLVVWFAISGVWGGVAHAEQLKTIANEAPALLYYTEKDFIFRLENEKKIDVERWKGLRPGGRTSYLLKFYYANTRAKSDRGFKHVVCYEGLGSQVAKEFFGANAPKIRDTKDIVTSVCEDETMIGVDFVAEEKDKSVNRHFRLTSCAVAGKNPVVSEDNELLPKKVNQRGKGKLNVIPVAFLADDKDVDDDTTKVVDSLLDKEDGFSISDTVTDKERQGERGLLPLFALKSDYQNAKEEKVTPWNGMGVANQKSARELVLTAQKYFYEGMANQNSQNPELNFLPEEALKINGRYWCNMPWLNVGANGREAIHGLTNERPLNRSENIYPFDPSKVSGSDWGVAFYNGTACKTLGAVFGSSEPGKRKAIPDWKQKFADGSMAVKILFTTANYEKFANAFAWQAHVSAPFSTHREIQTVRHIQMDIWIKDSRLGGIDKSIADGGMMMTYYYDENYDSRKQDLIVGSIQGLPEAFYHMRPMGVQVGFEVQNTTVFADAQTNQDHLLLNGPADNPKSSCMSCHGTAGTSIPMAPGITKNADFAANAKDTLDQSQQLALARRNFQTQSQATKK